MNKEKESGKAEKKQGFGDKIKKIRNRGDFTAALMLLPAVFLLVIISIYPFIWLFRYVCYDYNGMTAYYVGMRNFTRMLNDTTFWRSVIHTFEYAILKIIFIIPFSLLMAVFLNQKLRGSSFFRGVYFMPTVISTAVSSLVFGFVFSAYNGVLNGILKAIGIIDNNINWLGDTKTAMWSVLIVAVWAGFGNYMIYFISGMAGIPEDIYESAKIDGANGTQTFFRITLPMLSPMLKIILMLAITGAFKDYDSILVLTQGGPNNRTQVMFLYIYQLIFGTSAGAPPQIGYGTVLSIVAALIIGIITAIYLFLARKLDEVI